MNFAETIAWILEKYVLVKLSISCYSILFKGLILLIPLLGLIIWMVSGQLLLQILDYLNRVLVIIFFWIFVDQGLKTWIFKKLRVIVLLSLRLILILKYIILLNYCLPVIYESPQLFFDLHSVILRFILLTSCMEFPLLMNFREVACKQPYAIIWLIMALKKAETDAVEQIACRVILFFIK